jgi:hypothetical protein
MKREELNKKLELHLMWLNGDPKGRRANLRCAVLNGVELKGADLRGAILSGAYLCGANFQEADLRKTDLSWANLCGADLGLVDLNGATLHGAILRGAYLGGVELRGVELKGADLRGAELPQGCTFYYDLPRHNIMIVHDVAHIGCHSRQMTDWLERGQWIGIINGYTEDEIRVYMEILRREHEARRAK